MAADNYFEEKIGTLGYELFGVSCFAFVMIVLSNFVARPYKKENCAKWCDMLAYLVLIFAWIWGVFIKNTFAMDNMKKSDTFTQPAPFLSYVKLWITSMTYYIFVNMIRLAVEHCGHACRKGPHDLLRQKNDFMAYY